MRICDLPGYDISGEHYVEMDQRYVSEVRQILKKRKMARVRSPNRSEPTKRASARCASPCK